MSKRVPIGHNQPHHARPKTRASNIIPTEINDPARICRAAMDCAIINNGSKRIGKFTTAAGQAKPVDAMTSMVKTASETPCTTLRAVTQFEPAVDRLCANRKFLNLH
jgi:hypothetical protein